MKIYSNTLLYIRENDKYNTILFFCPGLNCGKSSSLNGQINHQELRLFKCGILCCGEKVCVWLFVRICVSAVHVVMEWNTMTETTGFYGDSNGEQEWFMMGMFRKRARVIFLSVSLAHSLS